MQVRCYVHGCEHNKEIGWIAYLSACLFTCSLRPYVCRAHYDLFDEEE